MSKTVADLDVANQVSLSFVNDGDVYRKDSIPLIRQLQSDVARGEYKHENATIYWFNILERNWLHFRRQCGFSVRDYISEATKFEAARQISDNYREHIESGE